MSGPVRILVDADACPVKEEIYRVAFRREVPVRVVSNSYLRVPAHPLPAAIDMADTSTETHLDLSEPGLLDAMTAPRT